MLTAIKSSWPGSSRPSTFYFFVAKKVVDARDEPGHDDVADCAPALSAFRQLQFDTAIALVGLFGGRGVERLEFGEAGRDQPLRRHAERNQVLHHRDRTRRRQFPVRLVYRAVDRPHIGMTVDPQHPGDFARYPLVEID